MSQHAEECIDRGRTVHCIASTESVSVFAALLDSHVDVVTLIGAPALYAAIADSENYEWPLASFIPAVLE